MRLRGTNPIYRFSAKNRRLEKMIHPLESQYGFSAKELLDGLSRRFRAKVALEGVVAEIQMKKKIEYVTRKGIISHYEEHDKDNYPDFTIKLKKIKKPLRIECKNIRDSHEAYKTGGKVVAYKVETQKTRAAKADPSSRFYETNRFEILAVCLGKKTGHWKDFLFANTFDLNRHQKYPEKLAVFQRVPLPTSRNISPWFRSLEDLLMSRFKGKI